MVKRLVAVSSYSIFKATVFLKHYLHHRGVSDDCEFYHQQYCRGRVEREIITDMHDLRKLAILENSAAEMLIRYILHVWLISKLSTDRFTWQLKGGFSEYWFVFV